MPSKYTDSKSNMVLMNTMCDILQFVVVVSVPVKSSATVADTFILETCADEVLFESSRCAR